MSQGIPSYESSVRAAAKGDANPIHKFIIRNEPAGEREELAFRAELEDVIRFVERAPASPTRVDHLSLLRHIALTVPGAWDAIATWNGLRDAPDEQIAAMLRVTRVG